jgi:hypothetical protein
VKAAHFASLLNTIALMSEGRVAHPVWRDGRAAPPPRSRSGNGTKVRAYQPSLNTAQDRAIAAHNEAVERRKLEKLDRKIDRKLRR